MNSGGRFYRGYETGIQPDIGLLQTHRPTKVMSHDLDVGCGECSTDAGFPIIMGLNLVCREYREQAAQSCFTFPYFVQARGVFSGPWMAMAMATPVNGQCTK